VSLQTTRDQPADRPAGSAMQGSAAQRKAAQRSARSCTAAETARTCHCSSDGTAVRCATSTTAWHVGGLFVDSCEPQACHREEEVDGHVLHTQLNRFKFASARHTPERLRHDPTAHHRTLHERGRALRCVALRCVALRFVRYRQREQTNGR
jgi:hypothetical protein